MEALQTTFYLFAIVFFLAWIVLVSVVTYVIWQLFEKAKNAPQEIQGKVSEFLSSKTMRLASMAGVFASTFLISKIFKKR